ncbi:unnamed protein product [Paramecium sonneborni]|uniref:Uncharacterized protein n=1 Tax=Paramecium sonneborni TaxID=65129 RepID=A0A8S1RSP2_9CILI|nr:unnamed protein product [Paramecium sonneborni]
MARWVTEQRLDENKLFKQIGGGSYDKENHKTGAWIELKGEFNKYLRLIKSFSLLVIHLSLIMVNIQMIKKLVNGKFLLGINRCIKFAIMKSLYQWRWII